MPRIRRWFRVSHDINSDPEVWELTEKFGDRGLRAWLEILSIADRNDGMVTTPRNLLVKALSIKLNTTLDKTTRILDWFDDKTWTLQDPVLRVRNYSIYNPSRDANKIPQGDSIVSPPIQTSETSQTSKSTQSPNGTAPRSSKPKESKPDSAIRDFIDFWHVEYLRRFDEKYNFSGNRDGATVKRLLGIYNLDRLKDLALQFFNSQDDWIKRQGGYTIGVFSTQINKIISTSKGGQSNRNLKPLEPMA